MTATDAAYLQLYIEANRIIQGGFRESIDNLEIFAGVMVVILIALIALVVILWKKNSQLHKDLEGLKKKIEEDRVYDVDTTELSKDDTLLT